MKTKQEIRSKYNLPDNAKITLYRNPSEFKYYHLEPINPTHKIIMWGVYKKKHRQERHKTHVLAGRINIPLIAFIFSTIFIDINLTLLLVKVICSIIIAYFIYIIPLYGINHLLNIKYLNPISIIKHINDVTFV